MKYTWNFVFLVRSILFLIFEKRWNVENYINIFIDVGFFFFFFSYLIAVVGWCLLQPRSVHILQSRTNRKRSCSTFGKFFFNQIVERCRSRQYRRAPITMDGQSGTESTVGLLATLFSSWKHPRRSQRCTRRGECFLSHLYIFTWNLMNFFLFNLRHNPSCGRIGLMIGEISFWMSRYIVSYFMCLSHED